MENPWNFESLKAFFDQRFVDTQKAVDAALAAAKEAAAKAEAALDRKFEGVNEFRETLRDQQGTFIRRSEVEVMVNGLAEKVHDLQKMALSGIDERRGMKGGWGWAVAVISLVLAALALSDAI